MQVLQNCLKEVASLYSTLKISFNSCFEKGVRIETQKTRFSKNDKVERTTFFLASSKF